MRIGSSLDCGEARIFRRQSRGDAFQHPCSAEIQSVGMRESRVARIADHFRLWPFFIWQKVGEPRCELARRQHAAHHICLGNTRRKEVLARWLIAEWTRFVVDEESPRRISGD